MYRINSHMILCLFIVMQCVFIDGAGSLYDLWPNAWQNISNCMLSKKLCESSTATKYALGVLGMGAGFYGLYSLYKIYNPVGVINQQKHQNISLSPLFARERNRNIIKNQFAASAGPRSVHNLLQVIGTYKLNGFFEDAFFNPYSTLNLSNLGLEDISGIQHFPHRDEVQALLLDHNQIKHLPLKAFEHVYVFNKGYKGFSHLERLNLSHNMINAINVQVFFGLNALKELDLSHNNIATLSKRSFFGLAKIESIDLSNNNITKVFERVFEGVNENLKLVVLDENLETNVKHRLINQIGMYSPKAEISWKKK